MSGIRPSGDREDQQPKPGLGVGAGRRVRPHEGDAVRIGLRGVDRVPCAFERGPPPGASDGWQREFHGADPDPDTPPTFFGEGEHCVDDCGGVVEYRLELISRGSIEWADDRDVGQRLQRVGYPVGFSSAVPLVDGDDVHRASRPLSST